MLANQPTLPHEMGHVTGLGHEQSRRDRDAWITVLPANIIKSLAPNFDVQPNNAQAIGLYDHQSIMQYLPFTFSKNGEPTIETVPPGIRLSDLDTFSAGDLDAIRRLYGQAPAAVTITSNPPGLQVIVDGATVTTPFVAAFAIGSRHMLAMPANAQTLAGDAYLPGRWNDGFAAAHAITIAPGNGLPASPAARPAVTVYQADFVQMRPFAPNIWPTGAGTVTPSPPPLALPGVAGLYYPARTAVTLTSTGTTHHLDVQVTPQLPYSYSIRYPFTGWSDHGALAHDVVVPAAAATWTAKFDTQFNVVTWASPGCGGGVSASPASADTFYAKGATVSFDETPVAGWLFSGWQQDLAGTPHPKSLVMTDERLVVAGYNTSATPLSVASLVPAYATAGSKGLALTINGTGFTPATRVFVDGLYVAPTKATATQLKVKLTTAPLKAAGAVELSVDNVPAGNWPCSTYVLKTLPVLASTALPVVAAAPARLVFPAQAVGTSSAAQTVTLANSGTALASVLAPAVTGGNAADFSVASNCGDSLPAAAQCTLAITFRPGAKGLRAATLLLLDSAFDSPQSVALTGTGSP